jgi:formylmethanofuran dehydrogenase subunit C
MPDAMIRLTYTSTTTIPVEAECVTPNNLAGKTAAEIVALRVQHGNAQATLGDFFRVEGDAGDQHVVVAGDCARVKLLGAGMTSGSLCIEGNAGMHVGAEMRGGSLEVKGDAGDWAGAEMRDGTLRIRGAAGDLAGAGYRGSRLGMRGGRILIDGNAGHEIGSGMRRGFIAVGGNAGDFTGVSMTAGTLLVFGKAGVRTGAGLKRGTVVVCGEAPQLLPTFRFDCVYRPVFLRVYLRYLCAAGFAVAREWIDGTYRRYSGDLVSIGKGELLTSV